MSASIAHMLIAEAALNELEGQPDFEKFKAVILKNKPYFMLGSIGPDLPYYGSMLKAAVKLVLDYPGKPMGVDHWSYQLHSKTPNQFPLKMLEVTWRDTGEDWDERDEKNFAFICGFLSHMATDQIIHPVVNSIAGPYYKGGEHRKIHMECEVYQDVILYNKIKGKDLMDASPNEWCDLNPNWGKNTEDWFRYMIQKAFVEAHAVCPTEDEIEGWVDGVLITLRGINNFGPYIKATNDVNKTKEAGEKYGKYFSGVSYERTCYQKAIELTKVYINAAFMVYNTEDGEWNDVERNRFTSVVRDADLSAPLEGNILETAQAKLAEWQKDKGV